MWWSRLALHMVNAVLVVVGARIWGSLTTLPGAGAVAALVFTAATATVVIERLPEYNLAPRRPVDAWLHLNYYGGLGIVAGCLAVVTVGSAEWAQAAAGTAVIVASIIAGSSLPRFPAAWLHAVVLTAIMWLFLGPRLAAPLLILPALCYASAVLTLWYVGSLKTSERARHLEAALKVSDERLRFAQELHDTLGQNLAALSIKTELARALVKRGDARADGELKEIQRLTKASMSGMRAVVDGYRRASLDTELAGARQLLESAGIRVTFTGAVEDVPAEFRERAGWFVREAATNVLKHAQATYVDVEITPNAIRLRNDGAHGEVGEEAGLAALRRRGTNIHTQHANETFTVEMRFHD